MLTVFARQQAIQEEDGGSLTDMTIFEQALRIAAKTILVNETVEAVEAQRRYQICGQCKFRDEAKDMCGVCGCFLDIKTGAKTNWNALKLRNEITHCPVGSWGDIDTANTYRQMDGKELLNT